MKVARSGEFAGRDAGSVLIRTIQSDELVFLRNATVSGN